jgi:hypothetical protein
MALAEELNMATTRIPGGTVVPVGTYFNPGNLAVQAAANGDTLPALDWWYKLSATSSTSLATAATNLNALLNNPTPGLLNSTGTAYAYTSALLSAYTASMLPESKGQGPCDA